jgi:hypothetical protein
MKRLLILAALAVMLGGEVKADFVISGFLANPSGNDSFYEYVQFYALQDINFTTSNYSVVWNNNGTATSAGWAAGGTTTYKFNLTSGSVTAGQTFYVGGSGKLINGAGSTDISSAIWIRTINTNTTVGDGFGTAGGTGGVWGNGGGNADGIAVFSGTTVTSTSTPIDALFFGTGVGSAKPATGGYIMPTNDRYSNTQGTFGNGTNTYLYADPGGGAYTKLTGIYDLSTNSWSTARVGSQITSPTSLSQIASGISTVPEPTTGLLLGIGTLACAAFRRDRRVA